MNAVIEIPDGTKLCQRCMLFVDEYGNPDPAKYSPEWIAKFNATPVTSGILKCTHRRGSQ